MLQKKLKLILGQQPNVGIIKDHYKVATQKVKDLGMELWELQVNPDVQLVSVVEARLIKVLKAMKLCGCLAWTD